MNYILCTVIYVGSIENQSVTIGRGGLYMYKAYRFAETVSFWCVNSRIHLMLYFLKSASNLFS
jgi:hypothetical protein